MIPQLASRAGGSWELACAPKPFLTLLPAIAAASCRIISPPFANTPAACTGGAPQISQTIFFFILEALTPVYSSGGGTMIDLV
jgi:hypothetical protein